jgi:hypothetical protein|tara:strand:- start:1078 stop:1275 length:198 start_codon:yes stop_codon:yes gene_type:complete
MEKMTFEQFMMQRGDLMRFLISVKLAAVVGDNDAVVDMVNRAFMDHLEYLESTNDLMSEFFLSEM